jgi:predicted nucleic acid-binding protein
LYDVVRPTKREVLLAATYTEVKDAPIVAAAKKAQVDYLVSLDRRHLVGREVVQNQSELMIVLPETLVSYLRSTRKAAA